MRRQRRSRSRRGSIPLVRLPRSVFEASRSWTCLKYASGVMWLKTSILRISEALLRKVGEYKAWQHTSVTRKPQHPEPSVPPRRPHVRTRLQTPRADRLVAERQRRRDPRGRRQGGEDGAQHALVQRQTDARPDRERQDLALAGDPRDRLYARGLTGAAAPK